MKTIPALLGAVLIVGLALPGVAQSSTPTDFIRAKADEVIAVINRDVQPGTDDFRQRQDDLKGVVRDFLDYRELVQRALGHHWDERSPEEQDAFVDLMTRLIETNYSVKLGDEDVDTNYQVTYEDELVRGENAMVVGTVAYEDETIAVEVMMLQREDQWVVWDVVTDDVSIQETYAESFDEIITDEGWDALVQRLQDRLAELEEELAAQNQPPQPE